MRFRRRGRSRFGRSSRFRSRRRGSRGRRSSMLRVGHRM